MAGKGKNGTRSGRHIGSRSPLVLNISRLGTRPGSTLAIHQTVATPSRIGVELIAVPEGAALELDLELHSLSDGVLVTGSASAPTVGECARCLTPVTGDVRVHLDVVYDYEDDEADSLAEDDDEVGHVVSGESGDTIDLEQPIIDAVAMILPFSPVCRDDCPGLCPECGVALADFEGTDDQPHQHDVIDPRWAKLAEIISNEGEEPSDRSAGDPR